MKKIHLEKLHKKIKEYIELYDKLLRIKSSKIITVSTTSYCMKSYTENSGSACFPTPDPIQILAPRQTPDLPVPLLYSGAGFPPADNSQIDQITT